MTSVCFTGKGHRISGEHWVRDRWATLAYQFNYDVHDAVYPGATDYLVMADPNSQSSKARTARRHGTRCISYADFERMVLAGQQPRSLASDMQRVAAAGMRPNEEMQVVPQRVAIPAFVPDNRPVPRPIPPAPPLVYVVGDPSSRKRAVNLED